MRGHSVIELMLTVMLFSIFLLVITAIFNTGLKSWNMVQNKIQTQQEGSLCVNFLTKDLRHTDNHTADIGGKGYEYAILQSAINDEGNLEYDGSTGEPEWQAYILYYTFPRNSSDAKLSIDPNGGIRKKLIRKVIRHEPYINEKLTNFELYFNDINDTPLAGEEYVGKPKVLSYHIYEMDLSYDPDNTNTIDLNITISKSIFEDRLAFQKDVSESKGNEKIIIKNSVMLKNTGP